MRANEGKQAFSAIRAAWFSDTGHAEGFNGLWGRCPKTLTERTRGKLGGAQQALWGISDLAGGGGADKPMQRS